MFTICCEVSYLYIGLLIQLSYLTYVRFLDIPPQTQGVIFNVAFEFGYNKIAQNILTQLGLARISARWLGSQLRGSVAWILAWRLRSRLGLVGSWLDGLDCGSVAQRLGSWMSRLEISAQWLDGLAWSRLIKIYISQMVFLLFFFFLKFEFWNLKFEFFFSILQTK